MIRVDMNESPPSDGRVRISKLLAERGICSRREADLYIEQGLVLLDGQPVTELGSRAHPSQTVSLAEGAKLQQAQRITVILNKPIGHVSHADDDGHYPPAVRLITPDRQWTDPRVAGPQPVASKTTGPKRIDTATASMEETRAMVARGSGEVSMTVSAAEAIGETADLKASFEAFSKHLSTLDKTAEDVRGRWASLTKKAQSYTDAWQKESETIKGDAARAAADSRRDAFSARIKAIGVAMGELKDSYETFTSDMSDIRVLLANDLTADGIKSAKPLIAKAKKDADAVQAKADVATRLLDEASASAATKLVPAASDKK